MKEGLFKTISNSTIISGFLITLLTSTVACTGVESLAEKLADAETSVETAGESRDFDAMEELYWSRLESSRMSFTEADVKFMTDMIAHHAQALIMSNLAPKNGAGHAVQTLAARIHNAQQDEIATMQKWLRDRGQPVPEVHIDGLLLMIHMTEDETPEVDHEGMNHHNMGHHNDHEQHAESEKEWMDSDHRMMAHHSMDHHHDMPGMLTQEQLEELAAVKGIEFDRTFLSFMIEHHQGAVYMVNELFESDGAANDNEIFDLASDIHVEQITEINRMKKMLREIEGE